MLWGSDAVADQNGLMAPRLPMTPRLALDFTPIAHLTLGASFGYVHRAGYISRNAPSSPWLAAEESSATMNALVLAPRVGYVVGLGGDVMYLWARVGLTYVSSTQDDGVPLIATNSMVRLSFKTTMLLWDVEPMIVLRATGGFAITIGGILERPFSAKVEVESHDSATQSTVTSHDIEYTSVGATVGALGFF